VGDADAPDECLELPRPLGLLRTVGWNLSEAFGLPTLGYVLGTAFGGRNAGLWAVLGAIWLTAALRLIFTGSVPALVLISLAVLTVQTATSIATGNLFIFLIHFPLANLALAIVFARTARGSSPIAAELAGEVIGLRYPKKHEVKLHGFLRPGRDLRPDLAGDHDRAHRRRDRRLRAVAPVNAARARHQVPVRAARGRRARGRRVTVCGRRGS